ncbi:hypothetical protein TB1_043621 [Malus domestica]
MEETAIISKLEAPAPPTFIPSSPPTFSRSRNSRIPSKPTKSQDHQTLLRCLAKKFLLFLNRALSLLPKRLADHSKLDDEFVLELLDIYRLCLYCLTAVSPVLSTSLCSFHSQRVRMLSCLVACKRYENGESKGFRLLERMVSCLVACERYEDGESKGFRLLESLKEI